MGNNIRHVDIDTHWIKLQRIRDIIAPVTVDCIIRNRLLTQYHSQIDYSSVTALRVPVISNK